MSSAQGSHTGATSQHQPWRSQQLVAWPPSPPLGAGLSGPGWQALGIWGVRSLKFGLLFGSIEDLVRHQGAATTLLSVHPPRGGCPSSDTFSCCSAGIQIPGGFL